MDVLAHALWTGGAAVPLGRRIRLPFSVSGAIFWGVFPDVFSFAIPALVRIWWYVSGATSSLLPDGKATQHFHFVWTLYYASHSLVVFSVAFGAAWLFAKRPMLEMLGWALHILIDIPTHQGIFALHFLWPVSSYGFSGVRWENRWFLAANYSALLAVYLAIWMGKRGRRLRRTEAMEGVTVGRQ